MPSKGSLAVTSSTGFNLRPLFKLASGSPLTRSVLVIHLHSTLQDAGMNAAA